MKLFLLAVLCVATAAEAGTEVWIRAVSPVNEPPHLEATMSDTLGVSREAIALRLENGVRIPATTMRSLAEEDEPLTLAIVYLGSELWIGNGNGEVDPEPRSGGVLHALEAAIDASHLASSAGPSSQVVLIQYSDEVEVRKALSPLADLRGSDLGDQRAYRGQISCELAYGMAQGLLELERSRAPLRAMIVIGDGNDASLDTGWSALTRLKQQAQRDGVVLYPVVLRSAFSPDGPSQLERIVASTQVLASPSELGSAIAAIAARLAERSYVTFSSDALPWDGKAHDLTIVAGAVELDPVRVILPERSGDRRWLRWLAVTGGMLVGLILWVGYARRVPFDS
jgi:hypothetical protein